MKRPLFPFIFSFLLLWIWVDFCIGGSPDEEISREKILAKANGEPITVGKFNDYLKESKITFSTPQENQKAKENMLNKLLREIIIDQKAASLDLDSDSDFVRLRDNYMQNYLLELMYQKEILDKIEVTDQEVRNHYQEYKEEDFLIPEKVQVRSLLIQIWADSTQKDYQKNLRKLEKEAKKKIKQFHKRALAGEEFRDLCRQPSKQGVSYRTVNWGFIQRGQISPEFDEVAFSLKETGEISKPVRDHRGYHLIQLLDKKEKSYQELDSTLFEGIREYVRNERNKKASNDFVDSLKNETKFVYNLDIINADQSPPDTDTWVLAFGERDTIWFDKYKAWLKGYKVETGKDSLTIEEKQSVLINLLAVPVILRKEAERRGYADLVEYQAEYRIFTLVEAKKRVMAERTKSDFPPPTAEEMKAYYQAHKIDFPPLGVPVHVYHIIFDDSLQAVEVLNQIKQGADFTEMAKRYFPGEQEIKDVAYDLGFITQGEMPDEFYNAVLNLDEGEVGGPVKTDWGFHLIKVVEKKEKGNTFVDIIPAIQRAMNKEKSRKHLADWEENLFTESEVWIDQKLLKKIELPKPEG